MMVISGALLSACELPSLDDDIDHSATTTSATSTSDTSGSSSTGASSTTNDTNSPLASISVSGGTRSFAFGKAFNTTGLKVIAKYENNSTKTVTSSAVIDSSSYNKDVTGDYLINVSYTENEITKSTTYTVTVKEDNKAEWTIMLYICGSDLESENGFATSDINEILSVSGQPDDVNFIIETGGSSSWSKSGISSDNLGRWHVSGKKLVKDTEISDAGMGERSTFESFLNWGLNNYPAEKTGVILWNHGGALEGVCYDENHNNNTLQNNEVKQALSNVLGTDNKLEFIGYDACLMQVQEIAEFNSPYANYMVASQETEAGEGWDYDTWLDDLYAKKDTKTILKAIVDGFIADNGGVTGTGYYYQGTYYPSDQTLSYLDLSKMSAYKTAWENMASELAKKISAGGKSDFNTNVMGKVKYFGGSDWARFGIFDVSHFLSILSSNSTYNPGSEYISAVSNALNDLVVYSVSQTEAAKDAHGLCFNYYCGGSDCWYKNTTKYFSSTYSNFTKWCSLAKSYGGSFSSSYNYKK